MRSCLRQVTDSCCFPSQLTCYLNMSADIRKWWESGLDFDLDAVDSNHTVDIVGNPVEWACVVLGFAVSALTGVVMSAASFDAVHVGLRLHPTAQA